MDYSRTQQLLWYFYQFISMTAANVLIHHCELWPHILFFLILSKKCKDQRIEDIFVSNKCKVNFQHVETVFRNIVAVLVVRLCCKIYSSFATMFLRNYIHTYIYIVRMYVCTYQQNIRIYWLLNAPKAMHIYMKT